MQHRGRRIAILALLLAAGASAGYVVWSAERDIRRLDQERDNKISTVERLLSSISTIASTQQAYTDYGRRDVASFTRVSLLVDQITTDAAGLRASGSSGSSQRLEEFWTALSALMGAESRARERLSGGDDNGAADAILASAREHVNALNANLRAFREAEISSHQSARASQVWRSWASLAVVATLWTIGLVAFALVPRERSIDIGPVTAAAADLRLDAPDPVPVPVSPPAVNLVAAAGVATDIARLADQAALPRLLARMAEIIGARGVVIWMGAGKQLLAVSAHGYDAEVLVRIPPIARDADNATAAAWRSGELRTVAADSNGYGAIVAPMLDPLGCFGVLAIETAANREQQADAQAITTVFASQLAAVLAVGHAASTTEAPLDRQAAAS